MSACRFSELSHSFFRGDCKLGMGVVHLPCGSRSANGNRFRRYHGASTRGERSTGERSNECHFLYEFASVVRCFRQVGTEMFEEIRAFTCVMCVGAS